MKVFPDNLPPGSSGAAVLLLQLGLVAAGFVEVRKRPDGPGIALDGKYDNETAEAVKLMQLLLNVPQTGVFDAETQAAVTQFKGIDFGTIHLEDFMAETRVPDPAQQELVEANAS